jgi:hypothetical protein
MISFKGVPSRYAKFFTALVGQALVYAQVTYGTHNKWVEIATAAVAALAVLAVPNTPKPTPAAPVPPAGPVA